MVCIGPFCFNIVHLILIAFVAFRYIRSVLQGNTGQPVGQPTAGSRTAKYFGQGGNSLKAAQTQANKKSPYKHNVKSYHDLKRVLEECQSKYPHLSSTKDRRIIIKYSADWCGPCKAVEPLVEVLCYSCAALFVHIDISHTTDEIADGVKSIPAFKVLEWNALASTSVDAIKAYRVVGTHLGSGGVEAFVEKHTTGFD
eukprot:Blabericola_migrator_1__1867@NODE_1508_length_4389_cov_159_825544_g990_i0_p2_GENE_NODE_1508_length_4389_cov_159_825544_g990_i0NODE_1508_length_4389_cov_159_825544_g990_i0_p2_ORF_typecomplete_len198_score15_44Thioredoxin/PF00085_20/7_4e08Thioredoxin_7/PF13899_6/0_021Thioredoxin_7/PF13899_6/5_7e03Thioredoxin_8/PF13905_6/0_031Thioredoxin_9/PF14595_6/0_069AhpCTSA/PF00578_21/0_18_NODE_1508_length_4389_cov_159_825544_g990_i030553648